MFGNLENRVFIVAEMANAHEGELTRAKLIAQHAKKSGADAIKFQVFTPAELAVPEYSYFELYGRLQMSESDWVELVRYSREIGLVVFADVFGLFSATLMRRIGIDGFKIHAADVGNTELLRAIATFGGPILLSTGGSSWIETAEALRILKSNPANEIVLMHGFQSYPTKFTDSVLRRIVTLKQKFELPIGFAGHVDGGSREAITLPAHAVAAGASLIEAHLTDDRARKGLDYFSSLNPSDFKRMVTEIRALEPALGFAPLTMTDDELIYRNTHKKQVVAIRNIRAGELLSADNTALKRTPISSTGSQLSIDQAFGHTAGRDIAEHEPIQRRDLKMKVVATLACRLESTRLYGKPLQLVGGRPIIHHLIERLRRISLLDEIILAISDGPGAGAFIEFAKRNNLRYIVGDEGDVLGRLIKAGELGGADIVLRQTTENPYIYWENVDELIRSHIDENADLTVTEKLPLGAFVEVISLEALKRSHAHGEDRHRSELCTLFIAENPQLFRIQRKQAPAGLQHPEYRLTVDTPYDLILVRALWDALDKADGTVISIEKIVEYLNGNEELAKINTNEKTLYLWR